MRAASRGGVRTIATVPRRRTVLVCVLAASATLLAACGASFAPPAAVVAGHRISQGALSESVREFLGDPATAQQVASGGAAARSDFTRRVLAYLIEVELARGYAAGHHIRVTAAEVQGNLSQAEQQQGGAAAFRRFLRSRSLTTAEVEANIEGQLFLQKVAVALARGNQAAAQAAFDGWVRRRVHSADVRVNPRYGAFDPGSAQLVPIDSTALLPA